MKVLWICNLILPEIAAQMGLGTIPKEGWVKGLLDAMLSSRIEDNSGEPDSINIAFAFPVAGAVVENTQNADSRGFVFGTAELKDYPGTIVDYYGFYEDTAHESVYDIGLEGRFEGIFEMAKPDIVHCFGTEFPHTLAAAKVWNNPKRLLIGIQGPCTVYAERYTSHIPQTIVNRHTFRDMLKRDSIREQKDKYIARGNNERAAVKLAGHIAGRTAFDKSLAYEWNPEAEYHYSGETLRKNFYSGEWTATKAERHRVFVSQADYPLKGFHFLLMAVGNIMRNQSEYGIDDIQIYVAGQSIVDVNTLKKKIKISSYGKYLRHLMSEYGLTDHVHILGRLSADEMKEQYLKCDTYVCCSECENSPNSLGEAMMLKVPIVTAEVGGISSIFEVGKDGYSYRDEPEDSLEQVVAELEKALMERWAADDVDERRRNACEHAHRNHDPKKNAKGVLGIYSEMME